MLELQRRLFSSKKQQQVLSEDVLEKHLEFFIDPKTPKIKSNFRKIIKPCKGMICNFKNKKKLIGVAAKVNHSLEASIGLNHLSMILDELHGSPNIRKMEGDRLLWASSNLDTQLLSMKSFILQLDCLTVRFSIYRPKPPLKIITAAHKKSKCPHLALVEITAYAMVSPFITSRSNSTLDKCPISFIVTVKSSWSIVTTIPTFGGKTFLMQNGSRGDFYQILGDLHTTDRMPFQ